LASASGRTFEGPQPKRPSAGFSVFWDLNNCSCHRFSVLGVNPVLPSGRVG
jgi:hypothetical protein